MREDRNVHRGALPVTAPAPPTALNAYGHLPCGALAAERDMKRVQQTLATGVLDAYLDATK